MKMTFLLLLAAAFLNLGCNDSGSSSTTAGSNSSGGVMQAPADYVGGLAKAKQNAAKTVDVASLTQAINMFQVDKGRYPNDLDELVTEKYLAQVPATPYGMKINYDAASGKVTVVKQ